MLPLFDQAPGRRFPLVTIGLIAANLFVWFWERSNLDTIIAHDAYYPCAVSGPCLDVPHHLSWWLGMFTSMFMHVSWLHILGNMLFLFIFGNNVEDALGRARFLLFYLACGLVATAGQTFVTLHYASVASASIPALGASGAIAGVLGAYMMLLPRARVVALVFVAALRVPAILLLGAWFLLQLVEGGSSFTHPSAGGGIAFSAHIAGFVFGLLTVRLLVTGPASAPSSSTSWWGRARGLSP